MTTSTSQFTPTVAHEQLLESFYSAVLIDPVLTINIAKAASSARARREQGLRNLKISR